MGATPDKEFASAMLFGTCGRLLFQQRDNRPDIGYPGWVGLFGGQREGLETFPQCVSREVHEEIGYFLPLESFEHLGHYNGITQDGHKILGELFHAHGIPIDRLTVTEARCCCSVRAGCQVSFSRSSPPRARPPASSCVNWAGRMLG